MTQIAKKISVIGRVQGVSFRVSTKEKADELGIKGWARNESDGTVSIIAEGELSNTSVFLNWCNEGPAFAKVLKLIVEEVSVVGFEDFKLVY